MTNTTNTTNLAEPRHENVMPEQTDANIEKFYDAVLINSDQLSEDVLRRPIKLSVGGRRDANKWPLAEDWTVFDLIKKLTCIRWGTKTESRSYKATRRAANARAQR